MIYFNPRKLSNDAIIHKGRRWHRRRNLRHCLGQLRNCIGRRWLQSAALRTATFSCETNRKRSAIDAWIHFFSSIRGSQSCAVQSIVFWKYSRLAVALASLRRHCRAQARKRLLISHAKSLHQQEVNNECVRRILMASRRVGASAPVPKPNPNPNHYLITMSNEVAQGRTEASPCPLPMQEPRDSNDNKKPSSTT